jgi:hypothetical protein
MEKEIMTNTVLTFIFSDGYYVYVAFSVVAAAMWTLLYFHEKEERKSKKK